MSVRFDLKCTRGNGAREITNNDAFASLGVFAKTDE